MPGTVTTRALGTVEILGSILSHLEPLELIFCQRVHPLWRQVQFYESYERKMHTEETLGSRPMPGTEVERLFIEYAIDERSPWVCAARDVLSRVVEGRAQGSLTGP